MEGYIFSWINFIKGWRPRYIKLEEKEKMLIISHKKTETKSSSKKPKLIEIKETSIIIDDKKTKFSFKNIGQNLIYFKAKTNEEKDNWMQKLNEIINSQKENEIKNQEKEKSQKEKNTVEGKRIKNKIKLINLKKKKAKIL